MQCTDNEGCFSRGKRIAIVRRYLESVFLCAVFSCFNTGTGCEAYSFTADGHGIFNVRTHLGACRTHEGESGTNKFAQELTLKGQKNCPSPCLARGSNPGSSDYNIRVMYIIAQWLQRRNSNPKTLGSILWRGRVRGSFC